MLAAAFAVGCGGGDDEPSSTSTPASGGGGAGNGQQLFTANCASCHTLAAAGANGRVGPNLDELMPSADLVANQTTNGGGAMPAFGGKLSEDEIRQIAEYVEANAGSGS
jgi:mono/diheme cytochrome c family protein